MLTCESIGEWRSGGGDQRWTVVFDEWGKLVMLDELGLLGFSAWCGVEGGRWCSFIAVQGRFKLGDKEYIDAVLWFMLTVAGWTRFNCDVGRAGEGPGRHAPLRTHCVELQWHFSMWIQLLRRGWEGSRGNNGWEWQGTTWFRARWRWQRAATSSTAAALLHYSRKKKKGKKEKRE
jgi:hypothetical protein